VSTAEIEADKNKRPYVVRRRYDFRCRASNGCETEWTRTGMFDPGSINCKCGVEVRWWRSYPA
jgi:hypothetical protein